MTECRRTQAVLEAFADGELLPDTVLDVEEHLERCAACTERLRFEHAVRISTRRIVRDVAAPSELRARIEMALIAEREREQEDRDQARQAAPSRWLPWRTIFPLAAAAGFALFMGAQRESVDLASGEVHAQARVAPQVGGTTSRLEQLLEEFVDYHSRAPEPEFTEPSLAAQLEPQVGLPVKVLPLTEYGALWEGGGVMASTRGPRAASLRYRLGQHRITVYVYDSARFPLRGALEPRVVRDTPVFVGDRRGYSIAAAELGGIGYALATDLSHDESAELAAALAQNDEIRGGRAQRVNRRGFETF